MSAWISIYDRLPDDGVRVAVWEAGYLSEAYLNAEEGQWYRSHGDIFTARISHWMRLPFPHAVDASDGKRITDEMRCAGFESDAWRQLASAVSRKGGWPYSCREAADCVEGIYRAMEAAQTPDLRDAARYRWLRDVAWESGMADVMCVRYGPEEWDDYIDRAMVGEAPAEPSPEGPELEPKGTAE